MAMLVDLSDLTPEITSRSGKTTEQGGGHSYWVDIVRRRAEEADSNAVRISQPTPAK
jgi:hypothetical protein